LHAFEVLGIDGHSHWDDRFSTGKTMSFIGLGTKHRRILVGNVCVGLSDPSSDKIASVPGVRKPQPAERWRYLGPDLSSN
jgi:hypothetical protein